MSSTGAGYDYSPTTFSPEGRIYQVEYAQKAVQNSGTAVGVKCKDGTVLALEKILLSPMLLESSNRRIFTVDEHIGVAVAGFMADGRLLATYARDEADEYRSEYGDAISPEQLARRVAAQVHYFTTLGYLRPFGTSILIAGRNKDTQTVELYQIDPTGVCKRFFGSAIGKGHQSAKTDIERTAFAEMTCRDALKYIAKILHVTHEEGTDKPFALEMGWICEESEWNFVRVPQDLRDECNAWAKQAKEADEADSDDSDSDSD
jgi:20S proteasome subunit alpha 7